MHSSWLYAHSRSMVLDMVERIKKHLEALFAEAPKTRRVGDMYQELLAGCLDKYADLTAGGMDEEEAYDKVIDGIGDVGELLGYIEKSTAFDPAAVAEKRRNRAVFTSMGVFGYFMAVSAFFLFALNNREEWGFALLLAFAGLATTAIIYGRMTTVLKYEKADDTLVEEMKKQMTIGKSENKLASLVSSTLWAIIIVIYLGISFMSGRWDLTWIIFLFAGGIQNLVLTYFHPQDKLKYLVAAFWCGVVAVYMILSFATFAWNITWFIFPIVIAAQQAMRLFLYWRDEK